MPRPFWLLCVLSALLAAQEPLLELPAAAEDGPPEPWRTVPFEDIPPATVRSDSAALSIAADGSATMLARPIAPRSGEGLRLRWRWKVSAALVDADIASKDGDDCAARVLVGFAFEPEHAGFFERLARATLADDEPFAPGTALCYVWAGREEPETLITNPYNDSVQMIVLRGAEGVGVWQREERDLAADFERAFGRPPPDVEGIAVMVDGDQTGAAVEGWFRDLELLGGD